MTFRQLAIGQVFRFASEQTHPFSGMARGPWVKVSARKYRHVENNTSLSYHVGSTHAEVIPEDYREEQ